MSKKSLISQRLISLWLIIIVFCSSSFVEAEKITLSLWSIPSKSSPKISDRARRAVLDKFIETHPDIEIIGKSAIRMEGARGESVELMAIAGGTAPDILDVYGRKLHEFASQGFIQSVDGFLEEYQKENNKSFEGVLAPDKIWEVTEFDGKIWGIPAYYSSMGLLYRKDLFEEAGLDPDKPPKDWDELYQYSQKLTQPAKTLKKSADEKRGSGQSAGRREKGQYGFGLYRIASGWTFMNFIWSAKGDIVRRYKRCPVCDSLTEAPKPPIDYRKYHIKVGNEEK
jgi:ABC-type glycerol-3-phosphate transport system substrate-binding protein